MPTPVGAARQCLAEAAAAVLDDAVAVARRRSHAQITSLHVVSALLALPSSTLREACSRARSCAYSPRLQFRALELCVGVALDRVSVSKSTSADPPVSNSLMAAIKRSQANQRRHPETFHLYQQQLSSNPQNPPSLSAVKVEMKHFIMSILDDPIVSRVFGDAGFRTHEIKMAVLNPLTVSRFALTNSLPPPLFRCNMRDFELNKRIHSFPFSEAAPRENYDGNSRRIGEILLKTTRINPLLIGVYASDAYRNFIDCLNSGKAGVPKEIDGLRVVDLEYKISECISECLSEEMIELKFEQVNETVKDCQVPGVIVTCGDFKAFVDAESADAVVSKLKRLLIDHGGKLWLIGFLVGDDDYKKLLQKFPTIEMDLDLQVLPITTSSMGGKAFKSSLMKSFVPFGGFFSMPSELEHSCATATKPLRLCNLCNEKYEEEVSNVGVSTDPVADKKFVNPSSWLQISECETSKKSCTLETKEDKTILDARVLALQRKWSDICQRLHCSQTSQQHITLSKPQISCASSLQNVSVRKDTIDVGPLSIGNRVNYLSSYEPAGFQNNSLPKQCIPRPYVLSASVNAQAKIPVQGLELNDLQKLPSDSSVTTDLTLGTTKDSAECRRHPNLEDHYSEVQNSESSRSREESLSQVSQPSSCSYNLEKQIYSKDLDHKWKVLAEKVYWQIEAIRTISQTVSSCRNGDGKNSNKGNVWLSFLGPDKLGKQKIAASVAEIVFGRKEHFISFDLNSEDANTSNSVLDCYDSKHHMMGCGRKILIDCLAEVLRKHPHSVVLLENVEKADYLVQCSLTEAVKRGKFQDSHGRDINLNNNIFILASPVLKVTKDLPFGKLVSKFPEETILGAKKLQMQILVGTSDGNCSRNMTTCISISPSDISSNQSPSGKRKSIVYDSARAEISKRSCRSSRSLIDLNLPVEDMGEESDVNRSGDDDDSEVWLRELLENVHENVVFKPFDFDCLSQKILKEIDVRLKRAVGPSLSLEIDPQVMAQILAAAWLTDEENSLDDWIEQVLCSSIDEARQRYTVTSDLVLKLVPCDGLVVEEQASGVCLPARINVN